MRLVIDFIAKNVGELHISAVAFGAQVVLFSKVLLQFIVIVVEAHSCRLRDVRHSIANVTEVMVLAQMVEQHIGVEKALLTKETFRVTAMRSVVRVSFASMHSHLGARVQLVFKHKELVVLDADVAELHLMHLPNVSLQLIVGDVRQTVGTFCTLELEQLSKFRGDFVIGEHET